MTTQTGSNKKYRPTHFKRGRKQNLSRPISKNVDPFRRTPRHSKQLSRRGGFSRNRRRVNVSKRHFSVRPRVPRSRIRAMTRSRLTAFRRRPRRKSRRFKVHPYSGPALNENLMRRLRYLKSRRNRYWRNVRTPLHKRGVLSVISRSRLPARSHLRAYVTANRLYRPSARAITKRVIVRALRPKPRPERPSVLSRADRERQRGQLHLYSRRSNLRRKAKAAVAVRTYVRYRRPHLNIQQLSRRAPRRFKLKTVRLTITKLNRRDRRRPRKRARVHKRPSFMKKAKQLILARQLIRKLRSVPRTATRALRRRLLRHKYRYFRKARTRFNAIRHLRRLRVKRRAVRRARRYMWSTFTVLRGARARTLQQRFTSRKQRAAYLQVSQRSRLLLQNQTSFEVKQSRRQQLLARKEQRRRLRTLHLLATRAVTPKPTAMSRGWLQSRRTRAKLRRRLARYTSTLTARLPHPRSEFTPRKSVTTSAWLLRRQQRVRVQAVNLKASYLATDLPQLQRHQIIHAPHTPLLRQLLQTTSSPATTSMRATLAAFRKAAVLTGTVTKSTVQTSRLAALTVRNERTRLSESRYYRTRAKLRLPNQRVRRSERKRQGLRLFARHTLKKPTTLLGRAKLLLPVMTRSVARPWQPVTTAITSDKNLSVPDRLPAYHPRVHFRGPRRYELGLVLSRRLSRKAKKHLRYRQLRKTARKATRKTVREKSKLAVNRVDASPKFERLAAAIQKAQAMSSAAFTTQFFEKLTFASAAHQDVAKALFLSRLQSAYLKLSTAKQLPGKAYPRAPSVNQVERLALKGTRLTNSKRREAALWHLRSVQSMLNRERTLSAWSPQYGTRFRRWSSPRRFGRPLRTRKPGRLARKLRRTINNALASRNLPKRKYFDRSFGKLQYYRGSAASLGYARYRRVYRPRSKNNRWWKPLKHAVPFTSPYSRRSLNAKKSVRVNLGRALGHRRGTGALRSGRFSAHWLLPQQKPRHILSSTVKFKRKRWETRAMFHFRVRRERAKTPFLLQRWLPARLGRVNRGSSSAYTNTVLARTRRSIRRLERTSPRSNLWAGRRWEALDPRSSTSSAAALFAAAVNQFSKTFWSQLRIQVSAQSKRAALQQALFVRFRSWHRSTLASSVVGGLDYNQQVAAAAKFVTTALGELLHGITDATFQQELDRGAFLRRVTGKQHRTWAGRRFEKGRKAVHERSPSIYKKGSNRLRRRWLFGIERYLKRSRVGRLPPRHRRGGDHRLTNYGRTRRRFPASGRRKQSYDTMLHAFAKRTSPSQFRRAAVTRFRRIYPKIARDSKVNRRVYELTRRRRLQRRITHTLSRVAYLSPAWRELLTFRVNSPIALPTADHSASAKAAASAADGSTMKSVTPYSSQYGQPFSTPSKRRFTSLPVNVLFKRAQLAHRLLRPSEILPLRAHRVGLLRAALRRRRMERIYIDLKKHISRRRLSKERLAPAWWRRKLARKREKYLRYGEWTSRHLWMSPMKKVSWTLHHLEERAPRRQDRALDISLRTVDGELLLLTPKAVKRKNWAKRGFRIKLTEPKVKPRRSRRIIRRRRRLPRRVTWGGRVRFHHWSEGNNYKQIRSRGRRMKSATARAVARVGFRSKAGLRFPKKRKGSMFQRSRVKSTKVNGPSELTFRSTTLPRFSSLLRRRGLKRLLRRAAHRRSKFLRRRAAALQRQHRQVSISRKTLTQSRALAARALQPFTKGILPRTALAPLTFLRRTRRVIKSEAEKQRAIVWNIKSKEIRYKKTAQYTESLTRFIPALMSYMISRHTSQKKLTYSTVKGLISATYWNLRIHLNVDPFARRLKLRDRNFEQLRFLTKAIARLAKEQITDHADRMRLRWRFQPCRLQSAPSSDRFRLDWLRAFFPRKHALYQEDPEYYYRAIVSSRNIRRVPLTGYGIGRARTYKSSTNVERRARHLLRMRLSRREPRLETVLQTTRRIPETELEQFVPVLIPDSEEVTLEKERLLAQKIAEEDAAVFARSKKFVFVKKARAPKLTAAEIAAAEIDSTFDAHIAERSPHVRTRTSFFPRNYSTAASRALTSTAKLIATQGRLATADGEQSTAFSELSARARVKARLVARGRTNFIASADFMINAGGLDPRFLRYKSPRSRQYGIRKPVRKLEGAQFTELTHFQQKREPLWPHREEKQLLRLRRRHFYLDTPTVAGTPAARVLTTVRLINPARRIPTVLKARSALAKEQVVRAERYNFPNRRQTAFHSLLEHEGDGFLRKEGRLFESRPLVKGQHLQHWRFRMSRGEVVTGERAPLLYRTPQQRTTSNAYRADRVLGYRPIRPRRGAIARGRAGKRVFRSLRRVQRRYGRSLVELRLKWTSGVRNPNIRVKRATTALVNLRRTVRQRHFNFRKLSAERRATHFRSTAFQRLGRLTRFTRRCIIRQRGDYQTPFDSFRPRLWHMLTHRWMKKHRILKTWLKEVNLWFKDPWLSLLVDPSRRGKRVPGVIRAREQQDGEVVTGRENSGYTPEERAVRVKAARRAVVGAIAVVKKDIAHTKRYVERASTTKKAEVLMRLKLSRQVLRKPRPSMWLANLQCKRWVAEKAAWLAKPRAEKKAHLLERKKLSIALVRAGKGRLGPKAAPLKTPANHFIPHIIWKDIQRRLRRLTWRESDDAFTRRGFRNAFKFYPTERNRAPWLEALMYNRSLYSTNLREFRRRQFPREQKKYKWLQRVRKSLFPGRTNVYIKGRRWPRIRMYNQRLHYTLFNLPDRNSARRHFKKLSGRSRTVGFVHAQEGLSNRLDNVLIHLNMAPTIFWARHVASRGLLRINGKIAYGADYRLKAGDFIEPVWDKVIKYRHFFKNPLHWREEKQRPRRWSLTGVSRNFEYHPTIRCYTFLGNPREEDLRQSSRLQPHLFRWFRLDSGAKKSVT